MAATKYDYAKEPKHRCGVCNEPTPFRCGHCRRFHLCPEDACLEEHKEHACLPYYACTDEEKLLPILERYGLAVLYNGVPSAAGGVLNETGIEGNDKVLHIFRRVLCKHGFAVDGAQFLTAPEKTGLTEHWRPAEVTALYCDQTHSSTGEPSYSGAIIGNEIGDGDATIAFLRKSHALHSYSSCSRGGFVNRRKYEWYQTEGRCQMDFVKCPAGSLILWDRRMVYSRVGPVEGRLKANDMAVVFVSSIDD